MAHFRHRLRFTTSSTVMTHHLHYPPTSSHASRPCGAETRCSRAPDRAFDDMIWLPADGRSGHIQPSLSESNVDAAASWVVSASTQCT